MLCDQVHAQPALRDSFNALTRRVFGFDFKAWDAEGLWTDRYCPHALVCDGRVVANVSVNRMRFRAFDRELTLYQLGTVMTDPDFRGRGLAGRLMREVLSRLPEDVYLFANDSVLDFYPRFGFERGVERQAVRALRPSQENRVRPFDPTRPENRVRLEHLLALPRLDEACSLLDNSQLYLFYLLGPMKDCLYELPEQAGVAVAERAGGTLTLHALLSDRSPEWAAGCFKGVSEVRLGYSPADAAPYAGRAFRQEDTTLFYRGRAIRELLARGAMFPTLSHA